LEKLVLDYVRSSGTHPSTKMQPYCIQFACYHYQ
jgi:hypothetical protein